MHAKTFSHGVNFVKRERVEIEFLSLIEQLRDLLEEIMAKDNRNALYQCLGEPYIRLARVRYILDFVPLSEKRVADARWTDLQQSCDIIEALLRDVNPSRFKSFRDLQKEGLFVPAFADPDAGSGDDLDDNADDDEAATSRKNTEAAGSDAAVV